MNASPTLIAAQAKREVARLRFQSTLDTLQHRLSPANLRDEAVETVKETAVSAARSSAETVRNHPGKIAAGIGLVGLLLARKPIARAIRREDDDGDATPDDTDEFGA
ncbi:DUF3618 domain-containing protein [Sphingomonas sp. AX6]|uniref:DUF3618 domain-containing protein n=1 Tax=Sphingomonas sp. AX6 TaxID=2653171 RepID=UPI0012F29983|nr:DUF3618 domain-containing protein [Sphingomonas sp. AX6]VXC97145.1 hypothetical protein SPHINGOAX6_70673 [Sphingomonas sp. AX6]